MENLNNLPPFYVGQKVICTAKYSWYEGNIRVSGPKKNEIVTVKKCYWDNYDIPGWCIHLNEYPTIGDDDEYSVCENNGKPNFLSAQESLFPSLTFKEVVKETQKQTCLN